MIDQIIKTWHTHNKMNLMLLNAIDDEGLKAHPVARREGMNVAHQFAHMENVRHWGIEAHCKEYLEGVAKIERERAENKKLLEKSLRDSGKVIETVIKDVLEGKVKFRSFKPGVIVYMGYLISHESHHRGLIMLSLKQSGIKFDTRMKWGIWEWGKE
jgi:uncharacterized damage-inducible protein DinB